MKTAIICLAWLLTISVMLIPSNVSAEKNKTVLVLFDLSESTAKYEIRKEYFEAFKRIVDIRDLRNDLKDSFIQPGDVLIADIISDNSVSGSTFPILKEFPKFSQWSDNRLLYGNKLRREKEEILIRAEDILFSPKKRIMFTDILSSLRIAERVFKRFNNDNNVLIILSDMKEESPEYNFARDNLNDSRITVINAKERSRGLPDLKGVKVYIAGARADNKRHFQNIQKFWMSYFKACGAILKERNYGRGFIGMNE